MSGGSYSYIYSQLFRECEGRMHDDEMEDLVADLYKVLHDLEWWQSCDTSEDTYRETVAKFKAKWFKGDRSARLKSYIDAEIERTRHELYELIMTDTERKIETVVDDLQEGKITLNQAREKFNLPPIGSEEAWSDK